MRGGQVSIEYMVILAFSLLIIIPTLVFFFVQSDTIRVSIQEAQARSSINALLSSAERVYYSGPPSTETVTITVPEQVDAFTITNVSVTMRLRGSSTYDLSIASSVPLIPAVLTTQKGPQSYRVEATVGGVQITET